MPPRPVIFNDAAHAAKARKNMLARAARRANDAAQDRAINQLIIMGYISMFASAVVAFIVMSIV